MGTALTQLVIGLTAGAEYAVIAAGLALLFGVLQIVNFSHGELYMLGAYLLHLAQTRLGLGYVPASLLVLVGMTVFGVVFYVVVIRRVLNRGWQVQIVATLATSILMINLAIVVVGSLPRTVSSDGLTSALVRLGPVQFSWQRVLVVAAACLSFLGLALFLKYTKTGTAMRALAQNREAAAVVGIPVERIGLIAVVLASLLAAVASVTVTPLYQAEPTMGMLVTLKAFAAVIVGGFGNVRGAIVAAFVIGVTEAFAVGVVGSEYASAIVFGLMIVVLLVRPHGVFGKVARA